MMIVGMRCTTGRKLLKTPDAPHRPNRVHHGIRHFIAPLDRFSFPSGHTLNAVAFSLIAVA